MKTQKLLLPSTEQVDRAIGDVVDSRDAALLNLLRNGLRCSEAIGLRVEDLFEADGCIIARVFGKGDKWREVPLFPVTAMAIWLELEGGRWPVDESRKILTSAQGPALSRKSAYNICMAATGQHPHTLRHIYATDRRNRGCPIEVLQDLLGHSSLATTRKYYHTTRKDLCQATLL